MTSDRVRNVGSVAVAMMLVLLMAGCSTSGHVTVNDHHDHRHHYDWQHSAVFTAAAHSYGDMIIASGDPVDLSLAIVNESAHGDWYVAHEGREVRFEVVDIYGHVVYDSWVWVAEGHHDLSYALDLAGGSHTWNHRWYGLDDYGYDLPPGDYLIYATLTGELDSVGEPPQAEPIWVTVVGHWHG